MFEFERSAVGRCYFSTISFGSDDALTIRLDTCASRSVIAINKFSESVRSDIRDRLEKALNDGSVSIWKSRVANGTEMDTYLCSINDVILAGVTMKKFYSERQKYFVFHYKASGRMRTDLQRKMLLRNANPAQ